MFYHNLKIAFRNLWKYRLNSSLNLVGLSLGIACALVICLFIYHEKTYDNYHPDAEQLYRVTNTSIYSSGEKSYSGVTPYPLPKAMRNDFPDLQTGGVHFQKEGTLELENSQKIKEENLLFAEKEIALMFPL